MSASPYALRGDEAELFQRHHDHLTRAVAHAINASHVLVEDACSFAWMQLLCVQPERTPALFAWLRTVAVREAYRLSAVELRDGHVDDLGASEVWAKALGHVREMDDVIEARRALEALAGLRETRRRYLALHVGGFTYEEIAELAGGRTWNHVNRHLGRARRDLRRLSEH